MSILGGAFCKKVLNGVPEELFKGYKKQQASLDELKNNYKNQLEKLEIQAHELEQQKQEIATVDEDVNSKLGLANKYTEVSQNASAALRTNKFITTEYAVSSIKDILENYKKDRFLNITLGRIYRKAGDLAEKEGDTKTQSESYDNAIVSLRDYIEAIEKDGNKENMATAYYNIACYHSLKSKIKEGDAKEELKINTLKHLGKALEYSPKLVRQVAKETDLDPIKSDEGFNIKLETLLNKFK